jgi:cardiolipin synthase A/B
VKFRLSLGQLALLATLVVVAWLVAMNFFGQGEHRVTQELHHAYDVADPQFARAMGVLLGPPLVGGNRGQTLLNGDEIFPAMLAAIRSARRTITFETYIYWSGQVGRDFADALSERARAGVKIHILLDWVGSQKMDAALLSQMRQAGVEIERYHAPHWYTLDRLNNRTHRKLLVVDGRVGFTGGVGIADEWSGHAQDPKHWRDTHYRVEGPVVAQMQAAFLDNWTKVTGQVLDGDAYFPAIEPDGALVAQVFKSSRDSGSDSTHLMYLLAITAAARTIDLEMAYFVPDKLALKALLDAMKRGVRVRILMPGPITDAQLVRRASRASWGPILQAGAQIYEYQPTMFHCKVLVVDGLWTSVGSTNFDIRSFRLNDEANLNIYDAQFASRQVADFERDLGQAKHITYEDWLARPWTERLWEDVASMLDSQL